MMSTTLDCLDERRRAEVRRLERNGLDYLEVSDDQRRLTVYFLGHAPTDLAPGNVRITGGRRIRDIQVAGLEICPQRDPELDNCMVVTVDRPGDFSTYTLCLVDLPEDTPFDPRYRCIDFTFKANCPTELDCAAAPACPPEARTEPEISYLAKDYASFRRLILDRLSVVMPEWSERHVPDVGITLVEILAYTGDYLSYYQDAAGTEAYLDTARQRISVRRHARLVDYLMHEGCNARAWVHVNASADVEGEHAIAAEDLSFITGFDNAPKVEGRALTWDDLREVPAGRFEVFEPLVDDPGARLEFLAAHNEIRFHTWGDAECCLPRGATSATLVDGPATPPPDPAVERARLEREKRERRERKRAREQQRYGRGAPEGEERGPVGKGGGRGAKDQDRDQDRDREMRGRGEMRRYGPDSPGRVVKDRDESKSAAGGRDSEDGDPEERGRRRLHRHGPEAPDRDEMYREELISAEIDRVDENAEDESADERDQADRQATERSWGRDQVGRPRADADDPGRKRGKGGRGGEDDGDPKWGDGDDPAWYVWKSGEKGPRGRKPKRGKEGEYDGGYDEDEPEEEPDTRVLRLRPGDVLIFEEVIGPKTGDPDDADPARRHAVRLTRVEAMVDELYGQPVLEIEWAPEDALPFPLCLSVVGPPPECAAIAGVSVARGNVVLVDHGRRLRQPEALGCVPVETVETTCEREGRPSDVVRRPGRFRPALSEGPLTFAEPLAPGAPAARLLAQDPRLALPWIRLASRADTDCGAREGGPPRPWSARRDLLASGTGDDHYVAEMDDRGRAHLRFGDGEVGRIPEAGLFFEAGYRVGNGPVGNVGADAIVLAVTREIVSGVVLTPRNPLPARGGTAPEPIAEVKLFAPYAFRQVLERAVTADDYAAVAGQHAGVQRAAATLRWNGSWYEARVAVDPLGRAEADDALLDSVESYLYRFRRIGHDLDVRAAAYVPLDVVLQLCLEPSFQRGHVKAALIDRFGAGRRADGTPGFFHPDQLTFGAGVSLSKLVAAAQAIPGVESVTVTRLERLLLGPNGEIAQGFLPIGPLEIARLDSDPTFPENGRIRFDLRGGR